MTRSAFILLLLLCVEAASAGETDSLRNAFLANRSVGFCVHMNSMVNFQIASDPMMGVVIPLSNSSELQLLGGYHATRSELWIWRSFDSRSFSLLGGLYQYFNSEKRMSPFVGASVSLDFLYRHDEIWGQSDHFLTTGNSTTTVSVSSGIAYMPTSFFQFRGAYLVEFLHDVYHSLTYNGFRQRILLGVIVKIRG